MATSKAACPFCSQRIRVIDPGTASPFFVKHHKGKSANLRRGETSRTRCPGSFMAAESLAAAGRDR